MRSALHGWKRSASFIFFRNFESRAYAGKLIQNQVAIN